MARLIRDHNPGAYAVRVPCLTCGVMLPLSDAVINLDGPSFQAYYHNGCVPWFDGQQQDPFAARCNRRDCSREN